MRLSTLVPVVLSPRFTFWRSFPTNLLTQTTDLTHANWLKQFVTVDASAASSPLGDTSFLVYPVSNGSNRCVYQLITTTARPYTTIGYTKLSGKSWIMVNAMVGSGGIGVWFDTTNGAVGTQSAGYTGRIVRDPSGSGWCRWMVSHPTAAAGSSVYQVNVVDANNSVAVTANGTDGVLMWRPQAFPTA